MKPSRRQSRDTSPGQQLYWYEVWSLVSGLQGLVALVFYLRIESMERNAVLLGLSTPRLLIGLVVLLSSAALFIAGFGTLTGHSSLRGIVSRLAKAMLGPGSLPFLGVLLGILIAGTSGAAFLSSPFFPSGHLFKVVFARLSPIIIWLVVAGWEFLAVVVFLALRSTDSGFGGQIEDLRHNAAVGLLIGVTALAWMQSITAEYLAPILPSVSPGSWPGIVAIWIIPLSLSCAVAAAYLVRNDDNYLLRVMSLTLLAFALLGAIGGIQGGSDPLFWRITRMQGHTVYARTAVEDQAGFESLTRYEEIYSDSGFLSTKPPGVLGVHLLLNELVELGRDTVNDTDQLHKLLRLESRLFPLLSVVVIPFTVWSLRPIVPRRDLLFSSALLATAPNFLLFTWSLDQALYPTLFMIGLGIAVRGILEHSPWLYFFVGAYAYVMAFVSFSLLAFLPACLLLALFVLRFHLGLGFRDVVKGVAFVLAGFVFVGFLMLFLLSYDPLIRFSSAVEAHREYMRLSGGILTRPSFLGQLAVDYSVWLGLPMTVFAVLGFIGSSYRVIRRKLQIEDLVLCLWGVLLVSLALGGQSRIEVGRLWLFMNPLAALAAAVFVRRSAHHPAYIIAFLSGSQLITTVLILQFQFPY